MHTPFIREARIKPIELLHARQGAVHTLPWVMTISPMRTDNLLPLLVARRFNLEPQGTDGRRPKAFFYLHEELWVTGCHGEHASGLHFACLLVNLGLVRDI